MRASPAIAAPLVYLIVDLAWWWLALALAFGAVRAARAVPALAARATAWWHGRWPSLGTELTIAAVAVAAVTVSTARIRFHPGLHGDEPKYLRFDEAFYQGLGFELTGYRPAAGMPIGEPPRLGQTLRLFAASVPQELRLLERDLRRVLRNGWQQRFNRAKYTGNWFIEGKRGGVYQVHTPGLSFVLLPGYVIDRWFFRIRPGWGDQFPDDLFATTLTLLLLYGVWTAVVLHVATAASGSQGAGTALTLMVMLTIPVAAMPFQIYPEILAGLLLFLVVRHMLFVEPSGRPASLPGAFGAGLLAGALPWLHVRLIAVSALAVVFGPVLYRRWRAAMALAIGCSVGVALLSFYAYHLTGSLMPTAMYYTAGAPEALEPELIPPGLLGILFDRDYGLLPYSPIYLLAIAGLVPWLARERVRAAFVVLVVLAAAVPSAGHSWNSAGGSPLRHLTAVAPLALLPLAEAIRRWGRQRWFWTTAAVLAFFSFQNAWAYNLHHVKDVGPMIDRSASGWKTLLLFPRVFAVEPMTRRTFDPSMWLFVWIGIVGLILAAGWWVARRGTAIPATFPAAARRLPFDAAVALGIIGVTAVGVIVALATGVATDPAYSR